MGDRGTLAGGLTGATVANDSFVGCLIHGIVASVCSVFARCSENRGHESASGDVPLIILQRRSSLARPILRLRSENGLGVLVVMLNKVADLRLRSVTESVMARRIARQDFREPPLMT